MNSNTEKFLDEFMERAVKDKEFDIGYYENIFVEVMKMLVEVCDNNVFRNGRNAFVPAYYEGITIGIAQNIEKFQENPQLILESVERLKEDEDFKKFSGSASNSKNRIRNRLRIANEIFQ